MGRNRMEAFSDGVLAIIITIMVLEMKVPHGTELSTLRPLLPVFLSYILSFAYLGIYWNNHHHLLHAARGVDGRVMWANLHLLFWLSLIPFATAWQGENHGAAWPSALYGAVLLLSAAAFFVLQSVVVADHGPGSELAAAVGRDWKGKSSLLAYAAGIGISFLCPWAAFLAYAVVAAVWVVPDRRFAAAAR